MPEIFSSGKIKSTIQTIPMFIIKVNKPKVKILRGRKIFFKIGLIKKLIKPKTRPDRSKTWKEPVNSTPRTNLVAKKRPKTPAMICKIKCLTY